MAEIICFPADTLNPITNKVDPFGLVTDDGPLKCAAENENRSSQNVQAQGPTGDIVATCTYGEVIAPSADYVICKSGSFNITLGSVGTYKSKKCMLGSLTINTAAGTAPTVSATGVQVEDSATTTHKYEAGSVTLSPTPRAQILFDAFTLTGDGCHYNSANYTITCDPVVSTCLNGEPIGSDVSNGRIECTVNIVRVKDVEPTLTPGEGWLVTSPLSCTNPQADYPTYSATLMKPLAHAAEP